MLAASLLAAARSAGHLSFASLVFIAALVFAAAAIAYRLRRVGRRPSVNWLPRSMRSRVNDAYRREGWSEPYPRDAGGRRR